MFGIALLCGALACSEQSVTPGAGADALRPYEEAKAKAGASADAHVKLALWCEARGLNAQRLKHLALAVVLDPKHAAARGLLGQLPYQGKWMSPEKVSEKVKADDALTAKLAEYNARRARIDEADAPERQHVHALEQRGRNDEARVLRYRLDRKLAPAHAKLGVWCEQNGLNAEALAHFTTAVVLDPHRETTWKHLGYVQHKGRWMSREQIAAEEQEARAQKLADARWEPLLRKWKGWLSDKSR
ncbi:MAG: hypothetical protein P4L84_12900, partial [Isosphaeraceae bacterium]|nr:hypothetical protein [Isosphaeraceae bacterium]